MNNKVIMEEKVQDYFDNYWNFKRYEDVYKEDVNAKKIVKEIRKYGFKCKSLIDVGCATGHTLKDFQKAGVEKVIGIEKYKLAEERICKKVKHLWINADAKQLDILFQPNTFDFAFCNFFMYCSKKEIDQILKKIHVIVKEGFWLHYPFADDKTIDREWVDKLSKKKLLTTKEMVELIQDNGFTMTTLDIWQKVTT